MSKSAMAQYNTKITKRLWDYAEASFDGDMEFSLDTYVRLDSRPPVFRKEHAEDNILYPPPCDAALRRHIHARLTMLSF